MSEVDARSCCSVASTGHPQGKMNIACIIDLTTGTGAAGGRLAQRKAAYEEIKKASNCVGATLHELPFKKLDFGETKVLEQFHDADVAIIDVSIQDQRNALFYHLGVRESLAMKQNMILYNDHAPGEAYSIKVEAYFHKHFTYLDS
ncbi:hypothetical protein HPB52_012009 [Rhipicephalus sanguineus]|uniref:Uncharacterized protein n=1 Tax=Rhipicephalus sanguineus TaxID=34632 RepID=A0A9D4SSZ1_RHISA|nr:hypothetical protein HPB52_012009 [Rhipicephalus sanguineus]